MNSYGKLWIVPDEDQILQSLFYREIAIGDSHTKEMLQFVKEFHLDLPFTEEDYHEGPCMIAEAGHLVIKSEDITHQLVFYLPSKITDRQLEFFSFHEQEFLKCQKIGGYSLKYLDGDGMVWKTCHGLMELRNEFYKKGTVVITNQVENIKPEKGEDKHVR